MAAIYDVHTHALEAAIGSLMVVLIMAVQSGEEDQGIQNATDIVYGARPPCLCLRPSPSLPGSLPPPQTIESFACKVRYFSIIRFVMGSLSSPLLYPPLSLSG